MDHQRLGTVFRAVRLTKGWRQSDVAVRAGISATTVSTIERGRIDRMTLHTLEAVAKSLDIRLDVLPRWRGGQLERLVNRRHGALTEAVAKSLVGLPPWAVAPEVSFSFFGERGFIDLLAWHAPTRTLLVIEVKTEIVNVQELIGLVDRKVRLAARIAAERGWNATSVAAWVVVAEGATNRRRVLAHQALLRAAFPADARTMRHWLREPAGGVRGLSFFSYDAGSSAKPGTGGPQRVRRPRSASRRA